MTSLPAQMRGSCVNLLLTFVIPSCSKNLTTNYVSRFTDRFNGYLYCDSFYHLIKIYPEKDNSKTKILFSRKIKIMCLPPERKESPPIQNLHYPPP